MKLCDYTAFLNSIRPNSEETAKRWYEWAKELENYDSSEGEMPEGEYQTAEMFLDDFAERIKYIRKHYGADVARQIISLADVPACPFPWEMKQAAEHLAYGGSIKGIVDMEAEGTLEDFSDYPLKSLIRSSDIKIKSQEVEMTLVQTEFLRKALSLGYTGQFVEDEGTLNIIFGDKPLFTVLANGGITYHHDVLKSEDLSHRLNQMLDEAPTIREYVRLYESAPQMMAPDVSEYRKFSEFGDTVLAGMKSEAHGFMFCTWKQYDNGTSVAHGDYTPDYNSAKMTFAIRSGLVEQCRLFDYDESANLYRSVRYASENCEDLSYEQDRNLRELMDKLGDGHPRLEVEKPSFEQETPPTMSLQ